MAGKIRFECLKCGACCRNLHIKTDLGRGWIIVGLFVMPQERKLFPADIIVPLYGAGLKGRSRVRPEVTFAYQITEDTCPHLTEENLCDIYSKRLLACRAFPLETNFLDRRCTWVHERFQEGDYTPKSELDLGNMHKCHDMLVRYIESYTKHYLYMWAWDLKTRKWIKW